MEKNLVLVSGAILFKKEGRKRLWFLIKQEDGEWEIPKVAVRKTESSARAALRMMGEQGGMSTKVLEEAGRAGGITTINGKVLPQRYIYYLMAHGYEAGEAIGFEDYLWLEYAKAVRKLSSKRERAMMRFARKELRKWERDRQKEEG